MTLTETLHKRAVPALAVAAMLTTAAPALARQATAPAAAARREQEAAAAAAPRARQARAAQEEDAAAAAAGGQGRRTPRAYVVRPGAPQLVEPVEGIAMPSTYTFVASEMAYDGKVVVGAPYAAEAVSETIQHMCDGNRIVRRSTSKVFRDSEGRTRREASIAAIGSWVPSGEPRRVVTINDPVSDESFTLYPEQLTVRKSDFNWVFAGGRRSRTFQGSYGLPGAVVVGEAPEASEPKEESLGTKTIDGVQAEGTRTVTTIPAGAIGNERAIDIVYERWYSPQLHVVVMTRHDDPRSGEVVYRLTNVRRGEQPRELFTVPANYTTPKPGETTIYGLEPARAPKP